MNFKSSQFIKNFSYSLGANISSLLISTLIVLIVPKLIGVEQYGYFQLYLFYSSYVGFLQFGWNDGIYLRFGGANYDNLDKKLFFSQFWMLVIFQLIIAFFIIIIAKVFILDKEKQYILIMVSICMILMDVRSMPLFILQATNKIKEYAKITIIGRIIYCLLIILFLGTGMRKYKLMIIADILGKLVSLLFSMFLCKDIVFRKISTFYFSISEALNNIRAGIKLMVANIASMLIIGVVRFGVERSWNVATFGKVSLTLSISNLILLFINAIGIVLFPVLRRANEKKLANIYLVIRELLVAIMLGSLILYYPIKTILSDWLPKYVDSLLYMSLLFPLCVYEGKMALLINTYLKTLRKEKLMLKINLIVLIFSVLITFLTTVIYKSLNFALVSIIILLAFRSELAEIYLSKILSISLYKDIILELIVTIVFITTGWFANSNLSLKVYAATYLLYLIIKRKCIINSIIVIKELI